MSTIRHLADSPAWAAHTARDAESAALGELVRSQRAGDETYFGHQLPRYLQSVSRIQALRPAPARVLDIGSHYLHQAALLSRLGYEVSGIDIPLFAGAEFVRERAARFGVRNHAVDAIELGEFLPGQEGRFDLIVFTEILEHITFNPVRFWRRVYELMSPGGMVYLSTPNALRPAAWLRTLTRLLARRGIGLSPEEILASVSYGHHWKEYSAWEIRRYFALLSPDFAVTCRTYSSDLTLPGPKTQVKRALALLPPCRSDIEAVVRRTGNAGFTALPPQLPMLRPATNGEH